MKGGFLVSTMVLILAISLFPGSSLVYHGRTGQPGATEVGHQEIVTASYISHGAIVIDEDDDFSNQGWPGSGSETHPYIIENLRITDTSKSCVTIRDTSVYFEIRNCQIVVQSAGTGYDGIVLDNVTHGTVRDCYIWKRGDGIYLLNSTYCFLMNNTIDDNYKGISLTQSNSCTVSLNKITLSYHQGISLFKSNSCILTRNSLSNNYGGLNVQESTDCTLMRNTVSGDSANGFYIVESTNCTLILCTASGNSNSGVALIYSSNCTLANNTAFSNTFSGFTLFGSTYCNLTHNSASSNSEYGVNLEIDSMYNTLYLNRIDSNVEGTARDDGNFNHWDDGVSLGNWWRNYYGEGSYYIPGSAGSIDHYPLVWDQSTNPADNSPDGITIQVIIIIAIAGISILAIGVAVFWRKRIV